jgi:hypothetical protein
VPINRYQRSSALVIMLHCLTRTPHRHFRSELRVQIHNTRKSPQVIVHQSLVPQPSALVFREVGNLPSFSNFGIVYLGNYAPAPFSCKDIIVLVLIKESLCQRGGVSLQTFRRGSAFLCESAVMWETVVLG